MRRLLSVIKWFCALVVSLLVLWISTSYAIYRIPNGGERLLFEGEVRYKFLELSLTNRQFFEGLFNNRPVRLEENPLLLLEEDPLFVSQDDRSKLWPEDPFGMAAKGYTFRTRLTAAPLLFGGYGLAELVSLERIEKKPIIKK